MKKDSICKMDVDEGDALTTELNGETYYFCSEGCRNKFFERKTPKLPRNSYELIIIGGGPSGLTAAVYAAMLKIDAFIIMENIGGQAIDSTKIKNYMGYDFITGPELIKKFKYQLINSHYIDHLISEVEKITADKNGFTVTTSKLTTYFAKTLIIATGMTRRTLNVSGEEKYQRKGVFYGNIQDYSFVQGEDISVIGGGNSAIQIVENLQTIARNIYIISESELTADPILIEQLSHFKNLHKYENFKVIKFSGNETLSTITIRKKADKKTIILPVRGTFISIGMQPNSFLVSHLVNLNDRGEIIVNSDCSTSSPGIFAAGDVTNAYGKRIIIASGEGAKSALSARQYILSQRKKRGTLAHK